MRLGPGRRNLQRGTRAWSEATRRGRRRPPRLAAHALFSVRLQRRREKSSSKAKHGAALRSAVQTRLQDRCCWISRAGAREEGSRKPAVPGWRLCAPPSDQQGGARGAALCQPELPATAAVVDRATQTHDPVLLFSVRARALCLLSLSAVQRDKGCGGRRARSTRDPRSRERERNLVDPASSHMLVSKIKPCMSKYKRLVL